MTPRELGFASIQELRELLASKKISREELLDVMCKRFEEFDGDLGSALEIFDKQSILNASNTTGILAGIPGIIKDNICQKNRIAACSSKILENYRAPYDATVISRLKEQGALLVGRANCDEFAMGSSNETSAFKKVRNPWNRERVPGGSSGGSCAAVAAGLVPWSLGSETGGSVRQPAALCGIVGLKPTYGLISRYGLIAYASSLDQVGIFSRTVYDNALVLSAIAGKDAHDSTTLQHVASKDYTAALTGSIKPGLTIGVIENALYADGVETEVVTALEAALKQFEVLGATIKRVRLHTMDHSAATYFMVSRAEAASNFARFDGVRYGYRDTSAETLNELYSYSRRNGFGAEVRRRILIGNYVLSAGHADAYYQSAKVVQGLIRQEFMQAFENVDVLFSPVSPTGAFKFDAFKDNALQMDLQDYFTASANLAGIPGLALPCGFTSEKLPIGFQLLGSDLSEELLFQVGHAYQQVTDWHKQHPQQF